MDKPETKKITVGSVLSWICGVLFCLSGLGFTFSGLIGAGIPLLLAGLVLLPPINKLIKEKAHFELSSGLKITIVIVLLIIYAVNVPKDSFGKTATTNTQGAASPYTLPAPGVAPDPSVNAAAPAQEEKKIYGIGDSIRVDDLSYKVIKAESFTKMGTSIMNKETKGKFVKVYLEITNQASASQYVYSPRFKLIDLSTGDSRVYDRMSDDYFYIEDGLQFGEQLQPGLAADGAIVFEVPKDAQKLALQINGDWKSLQQIYVVLPTVTDIGVDTTQQDAQDAQMDQLMADSQRKVQQMMNQYE